MNYETTFTSLAQDIFQKTPFEWQRRVGGILMHSHEVRKAICLLCVQNTGAGKTLLYQTVAAYLKHVTVYISPLLSLGSDQVNKLMIHARTHAPTITPIHLDEVSSKKELRSIIDLIKNALDSETIIVFASPQSLTTKFPSFTNLIRMYIKFIVVDELHLFNSFGRSFRSEFKLLKSKLFCKVRKTIPMLFLTATCTRRIEESFTKMIGRDITHYDWPSASDLSTRRVQLHALYSGRPVKPLKTSISKMLKETNDHPKQCIVYCNVQKRVIEIQEKLGEYFDADDDLYMHEVISIHGNLSKVEKTKYIQFFLDPQHPDDANLKVLCATSGVGNVGIDSPNIRKVFRLEFPPSALDFVQEIGRAGRVLPPNPAIYAYHLFFSIESFIYIYERSMNPDEEIIDNDFRQEQVDNLFEMARILILNTSCYYIAIEDLFGNPYVIDTVPFHRQPCGMCPYCRNELVVPPVRKIGIEKVLFDIFCPSLTEASIARPLLPWTLDNLAKAVREYPNASVLILNSRKKGGIPPITIKKIIFSLVAVKILQINYHGVMKKTIFSLARKEADVVQSAGELALNNDSYWSLIQLRYKFLLLK